ncbi:hypothetical protein QBC36DRAFT_357655 [Triangularia setosa]|uniref:Secreted protein n=1 Tax=Triangularia setosa TaxID=2587417 RepID=A0AAN6W2X1_9PEZI|nr:hypothetical protein QBC36DRAFT_357655 [Podospora setosa]
MLSTVTCITAFLALFGIVYSAPASTNHFAGAMGLAGYNIVPIQWELPAKADDPNGKKVTVNGTIQEAIAQMDAGYPGWHRTFEAQLHTDTNNSAPILAAAAEEPESYDCDIDGDAASQYRIGQGITYLRGLSGTAKNGPGPGNCGRVSCAYNAAIYWCNENGFEKEVQWGQIADGGEFVYHNCSTQDWQGVGKAKGQVNYKDKWNVVVRSESC